MRGSVLRYTTADFQLILHDRAHNRCRVAGAVLKQHLKYTKKTLYG
jgi:hypothetical protein